MLAEFPQVDFRNFPLGDTLPLGNTLAALKYQNGLLLERNKILSLENQTLLARIQEISSRKQDNFSQQNICPNSKSTPLTNLARRQTKETQALNFLVNSLTQFIHTKFSNNKSASSFQIVKKMMENQCPMYSIVQSLGQIIKQKSLEQTNDKRNDFQKISEALKKRRQNFGKKQKVKNQFIHIVKEPQWESHDCELDSEFIFRNAQKIIRITKRSSIDSNKVDQIFERLRTMCKSKEKIRKIIRQISQRQRQQELGIPCSSILQELSIYHGQLRSQYQKEVKQFELLLTKI